MSNAIYNSASGAFAQGQINWLTDSFNAVLIDTGLYTFNAAHDFYNDVAVGARVHVAAITGRVITSTGGCGAANLSIASLTGTYVGALLIYKVGGSEAASPLVAYVDTVTGLPFTPTGGTVLFGWSGLANGIFRV